MIANEYILSTHVFNDGPAQALREYLIKKEASFVWIGHALFYSKRIKGSEYSIFCKGREAKNKEYKSRNISGPIKYIIEICLNIFFVCRIKNSKHCVYIGYNNLNAFSGILLKKIGMVSRVVYYVIDYMPKRFDNRALNYIFHKLLR